MHFSHSSFATVIPMLARLADAAMDAKAEGGAACLDLDSQ
jgi:hypothetical protein